MVCDVKLPTTINSIADAKAHFSALVDQASNGSVFVICRAGRPLVTLTRYVAPMSNRRPDSLKGKISVSEDFDALPEGFAEAFT